MAEEALDLTGTSFDQKTPTLGKVVAMAMRDREELGKETPAQKELKGDISDLRATVRGHKFPEPPPDIKLPPPPEKQQTSALEAFGSFGSLLGILAGGLARKGIGVSLDASTAAMNAIHRNDAATYEAAMDQWKTQTDYALKIGDYQLKRYQDILNNDKATIDEKVSLVSATAHAVQNEHMQQVARSNNLGIIEGAVAEMTRAQQKALDTINAMSVGDQEYRKWLQTPEGQAANTEQKLKKHGELMMLDPDYKAKVEKEQADTERAKAEALKARALAGGATTKVDAQVKQLQNLKGSVDEIYGMVEEDPTLVGVKGIFRRGFQATIGQTSEEAAHDELAATLKAKIQNLQVQLRPLIGAKYFSGPAQRALEALVPGLDRFDDPVSVKAHLQELQRVLDQDIAAKSQASGMVNQNLRDLSDQEILQRLGIQ